jgi:hypothetical protein
MITVASFLYAADTFCDEDITAGKFDESAMIWQTSRNFHKTFVRCGGYSLEFDTNGDPGYDASGLGRIHKKGAPSAICLSLPFARKPRYELSGYENKSSFSITPAVKSDGGEWIFGAEPETAYALSDSKISEEKTELTFDCTLGGEKIEFSSFVGEDGVIVKAVTAQMMNVSMKTSPHPQSDCLTG